MNNYTLDMLHELDYRKNLIAEQRERIELLEKKCALMIDAIIGLKINKTCWCPVAIGNPLYKEHSEGCNNTIQALREMGEL